MMIRSITLKNVRRFIEPVTISDIGPGLNVLAAPNEAGKSTFFDALHAGFFLRHRSWDKQARGLTPMAGGDPEVTIGFTLDGAEWELHKCWSAAPARKSARLSRDGTLVAQGDEAEERLAEMIGSPSNGGPAGLLWVRQGLTEITSEDAEQKARQDIMRLVAGEVEAMTGGRRMEVALAECETALAVNLTKTGREKTGGPLAEARVEVGALTGARDAAEADVRALQEALDRRRAARRELAELSDEDEAAQEQRLRRAESERDEAKEHDGKVKLAAGEVDRLEVLAKDAQRDVTKLTDDIEERDTADKELKAAEDAVSRAQPAFEKASGARETAQRAERSAESAYNAAVELTNRVKRAAEAKGAETRRKELRGRIDAVAKLSGEVEDLKVQAGLLLSTAQLDGLLELDSGLAVARRAREASAAAFSIQYDGPRRVFWKGEAVEGGVSHPAPDGAELELDGIGRLTLSPAATGGGDEVNQAESALAESLAALGVADIKAARASAARRKGLEDDIRTREGEIKAHAPNGVAPLRDELAALPEPVEADEDLPSREDAEEAQQTARTAWDNARNALAVAEESDGAALGRLNAANFVLEQATRRADLAARALEGVDDTAAHLKTLHQAHDDLLAKLSDAKRRRDELQAAAPNLEAAESALKRVKQAIENTRDSVGKLRVELSGLDERISQKSSGAPEETLALLSDQLRAAKERLAEIEFEVQVNLRLKAALDAARKAALEAHVKPVHDELQPLLRMLWPDAEPEIDAETGMISAIKRRNVEEEFDILSGGTREQISLMVRLAFANILAEQGSPAPLILDDAIVYTDDDRIEQMFNALNLRAEAMQIIVFSCRQRAFRQAGGQPLAILDAREAVL